MNDSKYSILFMRDDTDVRRFRVTPFWLKTVVVTLGLLILFSVCGIYFGTTSLLENMHLSTENRELQRTLEEAQLRLGTLGNMEKILESYDSRELQSLLNSVEESDSPTPASTPETVTPTVNLSTLLQSIDTGAVRIEEIDFSLSGAKTTSAFIVVNNKPNSQLSGSAALALVTNDGRILELEAKSSAMSFQIQRRKPFRTKAPLPEGLTAENIFGLRVSVKLSDGKVVFSATYPLADLD